MKCEKHGVEMQWRGSLTTGSMYCADCAAVGGRSYAEIVSEVFAQSMGSETIAEKILRQTAKNADAKQAIPASGGAAIAPQPGRSFTVSKAQGRPLTAAEIGDAQYRVRAADDMINHHQKGHHALCIYCGYNAGPDHTRNRRGPCYDMYEADLRRISTGYDV